MKTKKAPIKKNRTVLLTMTQKKPDLKLILILNRPTAKFYKTGKRDSCRIMAHENEAIYFNRKHIVVNMKQYR